MITDEETRQLFGLLMARLMEDELMRDIETGLKVACLRAVARETLSELECRIAQERALEHKRWQTIAHLERLAEQTRRYVPRAVRVLDA